MPPTLVSVDALQNAMALRSVASQSGMVIGPALVSRTARYCESCCTESLTNGTGGVSRIVTLRISIRSDGIISVAATVENFWTTAIPYATRANTVY